MSFESLKIPKHVFCRCYWSRRRGWRDERQGCQWKNQQTHRPYFGRCRVSVVCYYHHWSNICIFFRETVVRLISFYFSIISGTRIHCSLWGEYAIKINEFLADKDQASPPIVVIQLGKIKRYFNVMGVCNAFYGTKLLLDNELPDVIEYRKRYKCCK